MEVTLEIQCGLGVELPKPQQKKGKGRTYEMTSVITVTSDNTFVDYRRIPYVHPGDIVWLCSDTLSRTRSLADTKTFTVFAELTKPSQSVVTIISSVRTDLTGCWFFTYLSQETIAGDAVWRSFRPEIPGIEYPTLNTKPQATSQDSEEYGETVDLGNSQVTFNPENLHGSRFSSPSPTPSKLRVTKSPVDPGRSNLRETKAGISYEGWKPEQLSNGNYRWVSCLNLRPDPYLVLGATTPARIEITAGTYGTLASIAS